MYHVFTQLSTFLRSGHLARRNILHFVCVGLFALSFALMGPLSSSVLAAPLGPPIHDGSFVQTPDYNIYRIAGGAPLHISDCAPLGGCKPLYHVPDLSQFRTIPVDGTFLVAAETGMVYRVAGGAPLHIVDCAPLNGCAGYIAVNQRTIDSLDHLNAVPTDGTFIQGVETGVFYRFADGVPLRLSDCKVLNNCAGYVAVNQWIIDILDHMLPEPSSVGMVLEGLPSGTYWVIKSGKRYQVQPPQPSAVAVNDSTVHMFPKGK